MKEKDFESRVGDTRYVAPLATASANQRAAATVTRTSKEWKTLTRTLRERTKYLKGLSANIDQFLEWMDKEMKKPSTPERGGRIAKACNALDYANQHIKLFALPRRKKGLEVRPAVDAIAETGDVL